DPVLREVLKRKFEKSSTSTTSYRDNGIHSQRHDDHQEDNVPQLMYPSNNNNNRNRMHGVEKIVIDEDGVIPEDETPKLITELQNVDKDVPTILSCKKEGYIK
ncbi:hypothetical protein Tco_0113454, partial [Tanacetum coccineum]